MIKRSAIAGAIFAALFQSGMFLFISPLPLFYAFAVYGKRTGYLSVLFACGVGLIAAVAGYLGWYELIFAGYFVMTGVLLGEAVTRHLGPMKMAALAILVPFLSVAAGVFAAQTGGGVDVIASAGAFLTSALNDGLAMQTKMDTLSAPQLAYIREHLNDIVGFMLKVAPAGFFLFGMIVVSLTMLFGRILTRKTGVLKYFGNVAMQQFPFAIVWLTIVCGAAFFAEAYLLHSEPLRFFAINGLIISAGIYFVQGCFVISFWLHKGRSPILRLAVYGLIIAFLQVVGFLIIALGLSDQWLNFRARSITKSQSV